MTSTRQERERRAMAEEIIGTATAMVRAEGAANLSLREVAKRLDYSSAALYRYFDDKAALVDAVCGRGFAELAARLRAVPGGGSAGERLLLQAEAYLGFAADEPQLYTLMFVDVWPDRDGQVGPASFEQLLGDSAFGALHAVLADGAASGEFRLQPGEVLPASVAAWALVHGYAMLRIRTPGPVTDAVVRHGLQIQLAGLRAGPAVA